MTRLFDWVMGLMAQVPHSLIGLLGRLSIALVFWNAGRTMVKGWNIFQVDENTLQLFRAEYRLPYVQPELAALAAQIAGHVLPALLVIGLATRFSALGLLIMTMVIQIFVYPGAYIVHGTWAAILLMLVKYGPGALSADRLLYRR